MKVPSILQKGVSVTFYGIELECTRYEREDSEDFSEMIVLPTIQDALNFKAALESLKWDNQGQYSLSEPLPELIKQEVLDCFSAPGYLDRSYFTIQAIEFKVTHTDYLTDNGIRKHLIDDALKEV